MYCAPGRMLGRVTLHDDRTLFLFVFTADIGERLAAPDLPAQKALLRERFGGDAWECPRVLEELNRANEIYLDRVSQIRMPLWSRGRVALVGDAAFCVSLVAGQGSALAMTSAYVLAGELAKARGDYAPAFAAYEKLLREYINTKQQGAQRFASAFAPKTQWGLLFRNLVIRASGIPGLARFTFGRDIIDTLKLPDYRWPASTSPSN